ncbi:ABC transporter permease [Candidatus Halobonum tyrrellensis]|uniref:ABC transporter integral membrane subunit n=1 Tax=Candidatus Halobonum tyrrellensis G22 TaxID=1324957 RepID=V4HFB2_9EURY|nr:ABC transporter permease [Candidatus Halobonum tyrrellensis]ESP89365.1 ABC transporter integral membrane subunit [Candidatus Halobonum tyrrellensis G22]
MSERSSTFGPADESAADGSATQWEVYREWFDIAVLTPMRVAWSDWRTRLGSLIVLFYLVLAAVAWVSATDWGPTIVATPSSGQGPRLTGAFQDMAYPLGTNNLGESILSAIVHATPAMIQLIVAGAVFSTVLATLIGVVSGYKGGAVDRVLTTVTDIAMTLPGLPLIILLAAILEPRNPAVIGIILTINAWAGLARAIRSQVLSLRDDSYVEASRVMGAPVSRILKDDIVPNVMPFVLINFVNSARGVIFGSVALYFLGILPSSNPNWGIMLNSAYTSGAIYSLDVLHWLLIPMFAIILLSFGLVLFAQGTEKLFNPRIRARHAESIEDDTAPYQE